MPPRRRTTAKVINAAKRNIRKAQLSRLRIREPRSVGRVSRSRARYSMPAASRAPKVRVGRKR